MRLKLLALLTTALLCQPATELDLRARIAQYATAWEHGRLDEVWNLSSPRMRAGNDNDKRKFIKYVQHHDPVPIGMKLHELEVRDNVAKAVVTTSYRFRHNGEVLTDPECHVWVRVKGKWYFDTYRSLSPDAVVAPNSPPPGPCLEKTFGPR